MNADWRSEHVEKWLLLTIDGREAFLLKTAREEQMTHFPVIIQFKRAKQVIDDDISHLLTRAFSK